MTSRFVPGSPAERRRGRRRRSALALTLALAVGLVTGAAPASAAREAAQPSPFRLADQRGDVEYSRGDLTGIKVELLAHSLRLTMHTRVGSNPSTWKPNETFLQWSLSLHPDQFTDYEAFVYNDGTHVVAPVQRIVLGNRYHVCDATFSHPASTTFVVEIAGPCLQDPASVRVSTDMDFAPHGSVSGTQSSDFVPQFTNWSPVITR